MGRFILHQAESLRRNGLDVDHFTIKGKGLIGYLTSFRKLKKYLNDHSYDLVHSHYIYSSLLVSISLRNKNKHVVSLLGSDLKKRWFYIILIRIYIKYFVGRTIVKSEMMKEIINIKGVNVIPNGVNLDRFKPLEKEFAKSKVGFDNKIHIIFFSNPPDRPEKNLTLARKAISLLQNNKYELHVFSKIPNDMVPLYMNAADILLMTSLNEGSPNVVKEAMACNLPIISVDVGDVKYRLEKVNNCHIVPYNADAIKRKIVEVAEINNRTNGREEIIRQELDDNSVAQEIISIYDDQICSSAN